MTKLQVLLSITSIVVAFALFSLPKSVVNTKTQAVESKSNTQHSTKLNSEQEKELSVLRKKFADAPESQKEAVLNSLVDLFKKINLYDSAAFYVKNWAEQTQQAQAFIKAGQAYFQAASFAVDAQKRQSLAQNSLELYGKAAQSMPNDLDLQVQIGMSQTLTAEPMQGILAIRKVLETDPKNKLALYQMGLLSIESGQWDKAISRFEELLALQPDHLEAHYLLGKCLVEKKQTQEAIKHFEFVHKNSQDSTLRQSASQALSSLK